jgi:hypothetical protein
MTVQAMSRCVSQILEIWHTPARLGGNVSQSCRGQGAATAHAEGERLVMERMSKFEEVFRQNGSSGVDDSTSHSVKET